MNGHMSRLYERFDEASMLQAREGDAETPRPKDHCRANFEYELAASESLDSRRPGER